MSKYIQTVDKITSNGKSTGWKMTISIPKSENIADVLRNITLNTQSSNSQIISVGSIQNELITGGNQSTGGSSMQILYPAGNWTVGTKYTVNNYSTPFVYVKDNDKYYKCIQNTTAGTGNKPGSGAVWTKYWEEITNYDAIYTENLLADNASFGDNNGAIIGSNYLYSQRGLDSTGNKVNYAEILINSAIFNESNITDPSGDSVKINTLNGNFTPNAYMDFYSGEVACNKFSEHFDYFHPFTITSDNKIVFNNTYRMDLDKSHNVCILPRYVDTGSKTSTGKSIYTIRPGVVVLPKYDKDSLEDGIHICISYPQGQPDDGVICGLYNTDRPGTTIETYTASPDESYFKEVSNVTEEGYVLVCADNGIFDSNNYSNKSYTKSDYEDCFTWNGWKSKFVLLTPGSELKLRSCIQYDINCTKIKPNNTNDNSTINGNIFKQIRDASGAVTGAIRKRIIGRQWVIENPEEIIPIPLHVNIDNGSSKNIHTFKQTLKGCQVYKTNNPTSTAYKNKINCNLLGLASGKINYRRGAKDFDINIYNINISDVNNSSDTVASVKNNVYVTGDVSLPLVNATIYCKIIPKIQTYDPYKIYNGNYVSDLSTKYGSSKPANSADINAKLRYSLKGGLGYANYDGEYITGPSGDKKVREFNLYNINHYGTAVYDMSFSECLVKPIFKYNDHYFMMRRNPNDLGDVQNSKIAPGAAGPVDDNVFYYLGHTRNANILTNTSSTKKAQDIETFLVKTWPRILSVDVPWKLYLWNNSNLDTCNSYLMQSYQSPIRPLAYAYYYQYQASNIYGDDFSDSSAMTAPTKPTTDYSNIPVKGTTCTKSIVKDNLNTWIRFSESLNNKKEYQIENTDAIFLDYPNIHDKPVMGQPNPNARLACQLETWMSYCIRKNDTQDYDNNWSTPIKIGEYIYNYNFDPDEYKYIYHESGFDYTSLRNLVDDNMQEYGWVRWDMFAQSRENCAQTFGIYYDTKNKSNKWRITSNASSISPTWSYINNYNELDNYVVTKMASNAYDITPMGFLLNRIKNESPYIEIYYTKVLQYGFGQKPDRSREFVGDDGSNKKIPQSRFIIDGPHLLGEKETEEHSIFYNEEMGTKTNNSWYYYENPVVLNLNISNTIDSCEDTGSNSVKNSVYMNQWGLYKASNSDSTNFSNIARHLSY